MVKVSKKHLIILAVGALLCLLCGFWVGKGMYDRPVEESVSLDTVIFHDTIPDIAPEPKDSTPVRTIIRWLPMKLPKASGSTHEDGVKEVNFLQTDTVAQWQLFGSSEHPQDSALVEIPITSKHYGSKDYDAWVSGFEVSLDSIKVYKETQYITETITRMKPPNKWSLSVNAGVDYGTTSQFWQPYASGELTINNHKRLQLGIEGGVKKSEVTNNFEPFAGAKLKLKIF